MSNAIAETKIAQKILIIEDEGEMCLVLNILLNDEEDLELDHVKSLAAASAYLEDQQPFLIILDNKLPDGYGVDYISYLKKKYPSIKIVMISGYDASVEDVALENGADYFLHKPFTKQKFLEVVKQLLGNAGY